MSRDLFNCLSLKRYTTINQFRPEPYKGQQANHHKVSIYLRSMASHHPIFNFLVNQSNMDKKSRDPTDQNGVKVICFISLPRCFGKSLKSYGWFQILCKLVRELWLNMLEELKNYIYYW